MIGCIVVVISLVTAVIVVKLRSCPKDYVCMHKTSFKHMQRINKPKKHHILQQYTLATPQRDTQVLTDPLYPPLNRTDRGTFESVVRETNARNINIHIKDIGDSYRLIGYLINKDVAKDTGGNNWKLMARMKDRNEADFYLIPTNKDFDVKVPLTPNMFAGQRLRDIYTIPKEVTLKSPLLNATPYEFVELPKGSFSDSYN